MATVCFSLGVQAQELTILVDKKGKVGYADSNGNEVIKCMYESAMPFSDGVAIVTKSGKSGIIDKTGKVLLPLKYNSITSWNKSLYLLKAGKKVGLADRRGNIVQECKYSHISKPNYYGKAIIALGGKATSNDKKTYMYNAKYGIIDASGNIVIAPTYKGLYEFSYDGNGVYPYYENKRLEYSYWYTSDTLKTDCSYLGFNKNGLNIYGSGIIDGNGNVLMKNGLYDFVMLPKNNMVRYYIAKRKETRCGYHNLNTDKGFQVATFNKPIAEMTYWSHGDFVGDIAPVNGTEWSFVDKEGKQLRTGYESVNHSVQTKLWAGKTKSGKWDIFDENNNNISTLSGFEDFRFPRKDGDKELFSVKKEGKYGGVNRSGEVIIPFEYELILGNTYDCIGIKNNGKWGFVTPENKIIVPMEYSELVLPNERNCNHFWVMKSDSLYYHFNANTQTLSDIGYKVAGNFKNGVAHVAPVDMKLDDTQVIRSQIYKPNTSQATIAAAEIEKSRDGFGYIINTNDEVIMDRPVSTFYIDAVMEEVKKRGNRVLTQTEKKNILLDVTRENRTYDLKSTLSEDEWNY